MSAPTDPPHALPQSEGDPTSGHDARIGTEVDKYTLVKLLGRGGMGAVYEARHARLARRVAIKFLLPQFAAHADVLRRFENEAQAAGSLEHPNVAAVTDLGRAPDGSPYLVMEFLHGQDCAALLARCGPLPPQRVADIVIQACRGLAAAHRAGIVHRDLKPENLFVTQAGDGSDWVKVLDFGIAKLRPTDASVLTGTGVTMGTAFYMSPEQARGAAQVDQRTDVWSLGVVLYELLTQHKPFQGDQFLHIIHQILSAEAEPLASLLPALDAGLIAVVNRAMNKDLDERWASVEELAAALAPYSSNPGDTTRELQRISGFAETQASPATTFGGVAIGDSSTGLQGPGGKAGELAVTRPRKTIRNLVVAFALLLTVTFFVAMFWPSGARVADEIAEPRTAAPELSNVTGAANATAEPVDVPGAAVLASPTATVSAATPQATAPVPSNAPPPNVRSVFEHRPPSSNKRAKSEQPPSPSPSPTPSEQAPAPSAVEVPRNVPAKKPSIDIDSDNPYAP